MFLSELRDEQKELFLDLCIHLSLSDGEFAGTEKNTIRQMCREMGINERLEEKVEFDSALKALCINATDREKSIILLEIAGVVMADGVYSQEEKEKVANIASALGVESAYCEKAIALVKDLFDLYSEIGNFLSRK